MMRNFILKITALFAFVALFASCESRKWEEVPVEYRNVYKITFSESTTNDILSSVYKFHLYYDEDPYALLAYSNTTFISTVSEIIDFKDESCYPTGSDTFMYNFQFTEIVKHEDGTSSYRYYKASGEQSDNTGEYPVELIIEEGLYTVTMSARVQSAVRPYEDGFVGYTDPSEDSEN